MSISIRVLAAVTNLIGDENSGALIPNRQFLTLFKFSFCKLRLQIGFENLDSKEIENFAKIFESHHVDNK